VLESALELFVSEGYAATTIAAIADASGVSVETIYKAFGGKPGLIRALRERALIGDEPETTEQRSDRLRDAASDPRQIIEIWAGLSTEVLPRVGPILLVLRSAAQADPSLAGLRDELDAARLSRMGDHADHLAERGLLRSDITRDEARDLLFTYSSPELYDLLVLRQQWTLARFAQFTADAMTSALLNATDPQRDIDPQISR